MARKSRKQNDQVQFLPRKSTFIQTAPYVRLSKEDIAHKGDSIVTQKRIISNYIEEHPDFQLDDIYADTGASGTTFDRPGFQRMLCDAEAGKIYCAHCGGRLEKTKNHDEYIYRCVANRTVPSFCIGNTIKEDTIKQKLLGQLMRYRDVLTDSLNQPSIECEVLPELQ